MPCFTLFLGFADAAVTGWDVAPFTLTAGSATTLSITGTVTAKVPEDTPAGNTLFSAVATKGSGAVVYTITSGNTGSVLEIDSNGAVMLATGKSLDFETTPSYTLIITAVETGATTATGTATLTVSIKNVLEFGQTQYGVCMSDGATADTVVGTYSISDNTASTTVTYAIDSSGNTNSAFTITSAGVLKVATGKTLAQKTLGGYEIDLTATESEGAADEGSTTVWIAVGTCGSSAMHVVATLGVTLLALIVAMFA